MSCVTLISVRVPRVEIVFDPDDRRRREKILREVAMTGISITRYPYEEPYHLNLRIKASNGRTCGELEYYCNVSGLKEFGKQLADFHGGRGEEVNYELGSEAPQDRFAFYLNLAAKAVDSSGHSALFICFNNNAAGADREVSRFAIKANPADINRLGALLSGFADLQHRRLDWQVHDGRLITDDDEHAGI
ncbi:MAG TPA: hypothetical protein VHV55_11075 [Pirellulales bacterium]|jgi:hypothetical protein|nr:hypothetical protein [Pirellulales bacterium]